MRKIREILRLAWDRGLTARAVARSCKLTHPTVRKYLRLASEAGLSWPLPDGLDDVGLERLLAEADDPGPAAYLRPQPDWSYVHQELRRKGVTRQLLWEEYRAEHPDGYQITQFCDYYKQWARKLDLVLRQSYKAGEKMFTDYAGMTVPVIENARTGEVFEAQIFVAVLGASNYTYAEATRDQKLHNWVASHIRSFEFFEGVPEVIVPDCLRSAVTKACRYEPDINPTYHDMAVHYGTVVIPARPRKPRDKAKVETAVQLVERWILAALRNRTFFSLAELNREIAHLLEKLNNRSFRKMDGTRRSHYEEVDRPALRPLPPSRFVICDWKKAKVNIDYHVELENHYYSVPYALVHRRVEIRSTADTVEVFHRGRRVASHLRNRVRGKHSTHPDHMPVSHREYQEWSPSRILRWARQVGPNAESVAQRLLGSRRHPEQAYRSCLGILRLGKSYGTDRLEAACWRAMRINGTSYKSIKSILRNGLDQRPMVRATASTQPIHHPNIRGGNYYASEHQQEAPDANNTHTR